jgi:hypothetical protein
MDTVMFWRARRLTPRDCLRTLSDPKVDVAALTLGDELRGGELRKSVLRIAGLNHVSEAAQVRATVIAVRGVVPDVGE